jgi:hypothetical protein
MKIVQVISTIFFCFLGGSDALAYSPGDRSQISTFNQGAIYKSALLKLIAESNKIIVTEHSDQYDLWDSKTMSSLIPNPIIYETKILTSLQRAEFSDSIKKMSSKENKWITTCIFEPHHTINFYSNEKMLSRMEICFKCGDVYWEGENVGVPGALIGVLGKLIERIGLHRELNWKALAREHYSKTKTLEKQIQ